MTTVSSSIQGLKSSLEVFLKQQPVSQEKHSKWSSRIFSGLSRAASSLTGRASKNQPNEIDQRIKDCVQSEEFIQLKGKFIASLLRAPDLLEENFYSMQRELQWCTLAILTRDVRFLREGSQYLKIDEEEMSNLSRIMWEDVFKSIDQRKPEILAPKFTQYINSAEFINVRDVVMKDLECPPVSMEDLFILKQAIRNWTIGMLAGHPISTLVANPEKGADINREGFLPFNEQEVNYLSRMAWSPTLRAIDQKVAEKFADCVRSQEFVEIKEGVASILQEGQDMSLDDFSVLKQTIRNWTSVMLARNSIEALGEDLEQVEKINRQVSSFFTEQEIDSFSHQAWSEVLELIDSMEQDMKKAR